MLKKNNNFCENCGHTTEENDKFCDGCGFDLIAGIQNNKNVNKKRKFILPFLYIVLIGTLIYGYLLIDKHYDLKDALKYHEKRNIELEKRLDNL